MARARLSRPWIAALAAVLTCLSASPAPGETAPAAALSTDPTRLEEHLRLLEQHLRSRLRPVAGLGASHRRPTVEILREHDLYRVQLDLLEARIRALGPGASGELLGKLRFLRDEVRYLRTTAARSAAEPGDRTPRDRAPAVGTPAAGSLAGNLPPANDDCASAWPIGNEAVSGDTTGAAADGRSHCPGTSWAGEDVWFRYTAPADAELSVYLTESSTPGHDVSVHAVCPGTPLNEITCRPRFPVAAGDEMLFRVASREGYLEGPFTLVVEPSSTVSGTVTDAETGAPVPAVGIHLWSSDTSSSDFEDAITDAQGSYTASVWRPGTYFVEARAETHRGEVFDDVACEDLCSPQVIGTPVEVGRSTGVTGIDFALERLASISGRVVEAATGAPIRNADLDVVAAARGRVREGTTDPQGEYTVGGLDAGIHFVKVTAAGYRSELYDEIRCSDPDCRPVDGDPIPVEVDAAVEGIDFALEPLGRIAGTVTDARGQPIPFVQVRVWDSESGLLLATAELTDDHGAYSVGDLYPGSYLVSTVNLEGWADEVFDDRPCPPQDCDPTTGTPVPVVAGATTSGVDFALDLAGIVTGTVTSGRTGAPVEHARVWILGSEGFIVDFSHTGRDGRYRLGGLPDGTYFATAEASQHIDELYDDLPCPDPPFGCDPTAGTPIPAATSSITAGIDFVLASRGISGRVTDAATGEPLRFASVWIRDPQGEPVASTRTGFTGSYRVLDLPPGIYHVAARIFGYREELHDGIPCLDGGCDPTAGDPVEVAADAVVRNVDFALAPLGSISGTVWDAGGAPLGGISVTASNAAGLQVRSSPTDRDGAYTLDGLTPDTYVVGTYNQAGYLDELYDDHPCGEDGCDDTAAATPIPIALGAAVAGVDFTLDRTGTLFGTVRNAVTGDPIFAVDLRIWDAAGNLVESGHTAGDGTYQETGLAPGTYFVSTWGSQGDGFIDQLYGGLPCRYGACDPTAGAAVEVGLNRPSAGIDFLLDLEQGLSGRVTHDASGLPVFGDVDVWDTDGQLVEQLLIHPSGSYVGAFPVGTYYLSTRVNSSGPDLADEVYDGIPCSRFGCDPTLGTPVTVTGGAVLRNLDFVLSGPYCERGLCLSGDRFRVSVRWEDFDLAGGTGTPEQLTGEAGTFWFFGPDNVELVVKVLDACVEPFNHFWVFAAGLTNVATEILITDTWTGEQRVYVNPLGNAFELIRDTVAFSCELPAVERASLEEGAELARQARLELERHLELLAGEAGASAPAIEEPAHPTGGAEACVPAATTLCLRDGRFQVESSWRTAAGDLGAGQAVPLTADTGYFWFFGDDNVEAIVKVLDACGLPGFRSYWVFAAGLTDVGVTLRVTDTVSGEVREYVNPLGTPFRPIQDTDAFATCP